MSASPVIFDQLYVALSLRGFARIALLLLFFHHYHYGVYEAAEADGAAEYHIDNPQHI